ncbi:MULTISPECIES: BlaI/MecI/CopY family transcriptional regulator [Sphingopyxis]|jgi:predicted transcriptional regulator|uniref:Predicted transcriptional regulator n=2 Tax=Sphingopyxis terrae TaxID=33052 RepID=A0A1Y6FQL5_9SPHN|nr:MULTISPECIES: BlaI/MecI/CopY family transcriptional regulator [Sphingopyxis]OJW21615.1 MAG: transcriptional regulator [Sphingopyxis sp. 65-8]AMU94110.1 transcriptional regulator [Sphingopyxis terrae subsp. terrae NBRC 15098]ENY81884.1 transcriptional regulator [Sphingopyxis sp. MC1]KTE78763.1 transcriptional regulator [Sphingopyxis sp. A083]MBN8803499.1 BlaI/MecI/CopY family transcriptional regulator [Sphingopyxis terrae]
MLSSLPPREREIVDILYERGASTVTEIGEALPAELSGSAIRAMLKRLEAKGFVVREASDRGFLYAPSVEEKTASKSALTQVVRVFFNGSATSAAAALLGMQDKMSAGDLDELEKLIAEAREGRTK